MIKVTIDGQEFILRVRVALIIRWLIRNQARINLGHNVIRFTCRGRTVLPSIESFEDVLEDVTTK